MVNMNIMKHRSADGQINIMKHRSADGQMNIMKHRSADGQMNIMKHRSADSQRVARYEIWHRMAWANCLCQYVINK